MLKTALSHDSQCEFATEQYERMILSTIVRTHGLDVLVATRTVPAECTYVKLEKAVLVSENSSSLTMRR